MQDDPRQEREAVKTTIVGGRPPGCGRDNGTIPRGVEVLVKKAAVDSDFHRTLLERRAAAARQLGLELTASEKAMIGIVPERQLESIIAHTSVPDEQRRAFMGTAAAAMLAALGAGLAAGCAQSPTGIRPKEMPATDGIRPDMPQEAKPPPPPPEVPTTGIRPDMPRDAKSAPPPPSVPTTKGIRPDVPPPSPPVSRGIRPDMPRPQPPPAPEKAKEPPPPPPRLEGTLGIRPDEPE